MSESNRNNMKQIYTVLLIFAFVCVFFIDLYFHDNLQILSKNTTNNLQEQPKKIKTILYWGNFFGSEDFKFGFGSELFKNCEVQSCFTTNNKTLLPLEEYDAILFHGARYSIKFDGIPEKRSQHQKYIFYSLESYFNTYFESEVNEDFYNWTMTYKRDSDIFQPYGRMIENNTGYQPLTIKELKTRTKKVAWFVSNCNTPARREKYAKELQKYIPVDIYGKCGTLFCPRSDKCYEMLVQNYKFYLSFENTLCEDYVTEKVFNILKYNVIPIVLGFVDYEAFFPKKSVIVANKFISPKHLAKYLWELDGNDSEYLKYFEWKTSYSVKDDNNLCELCKKLHEPLEYSSYDNVKEWFRGYQCVS